MDMLINVLKQNPLFAEFTDGEILLVIQLCEPIRLKKGEVIFQEGDQDDGAVYFIEEGIIKIFKEANGERKVLAMFGVGNVFGEMSFLHPGPRSASAMADEEAGLCKLVPSKFKGLETQAPHTAVKLLKVFSSKIVMRLRQTDDALMKHGPQIIVT